MFSLLSHCSDFTPFNKDVMYDTLKQTKDQVKGQLPIFYTEYNDGMIDCEKELLTDSDC